MGIDPRNLGRHIGTQAHHPAAQLIYDFKHAQVGVTSTTGKDRFNELEQRRAHQFIAVGHQQIHNPPPHHLDLQRLARQDILNIFRKNPLTHVHARLRLEKVRLDKPI